MEALSTAPLTTVADAQPTPEHAESIPDVAEAENTPNLEPETSKAENAEEKVECFEPKPVDIDALEDDQLTGQIVIVLKDLDLNSMTLRQLMAVLEKNLGVATGALDANYDRIKRLATVEIERLNAAADDDAAEKVEDGTEETSEHTPAKLHKRRKRKSSKQPQASLGGEKRRRGTGAKKELPSESITMQIGDSTIKVPAQRFKAGSTGFFVMKSLPVTIGEQRHEMQCMIHCAYVDSEAIATSTPDHATSEEQ